MQWGLVAAAVEQANIEYHELKGREAKKMKGRSKITFNNFTKNILQGIDERDDNDELATRADWLSKTAGEHAAMGNKLINIARRMEVNASQQVHPANVAKNKEYNQTRAKHMRRKPPTSARRKISMNIKSCKSEMNGGKWWRRRTGRRRRLSKWRQESVT